VQKAKTIADKEFTLLNLPFYLVKKHATWTPLVSKQDKSSFLSHPYVSFEEWKGWEPVN